VSDTTKAEGKTAVCSTEKMTFHIMLRTIFNTTPFQSFRTCHGLSLPLLPCQIGYF
jgi:hypothetical protein